MVALRPGGRRARHVVALLDDIVKVATIVGTRPQFIKAAPVTRAIQRDGRIQEVLLHTGQHSDHDMSTIFFEELDIRPPRHSLGIQGGAHGAMTGRMLTAIEEVLVEEAPAAVLVYGDTNSTLAGALAAAKLSLPLAHVEAGLRSFRRSQPEEINRKVTDHLSALLFCPTSAAVENLAREGVDEGVRQIGDVMYDTALFGAERAVTHSRILDALALESKGYAVATVHRAENTDDPEALKEILDYLRQEARHRQVLLPLHPRTRKVVERYGLSLDDLLVIGPLGYLDMTLLIKSAARVLTDSGGLQKEAYFHRVPCVTLRDETEWVETVEAGWNRLWKGPPYLERREIEEYGDGNAAGRIVEEMVLFLEGNKGP